MGDLEIPGLDEWIKDLVAKTSKELNDFIEINYARSHVDWYNSIRGMTALHHSGKYRELGYPEFSDFLSDRYPKLGEGGYYHWRKLAMRYSPEVFQRLGIELLAKIDRANLPKSLLKLIEQKVQDPKADRKQIQELLKRNGTLTKLEKEHKKERGNLSKQQLKEENKELKKALAEKDDKIAKLEMALEDKTRYIEELQKGERPV